jgi:hypothetical protein
MSFEVTDFRKELIGTPDTDALWHVKGGQPLGTPLLLFPLTEEEVENQGGGPPQD